MNEDIIAAATSLADSLNSDILLFSGGIQRPYDDKLIELLSARKKRENVTLFLCTSGGNPDAAYRMARALQENYKRFTVVVAGWCKSAGTLLVIGAHEIAMTDHAELGPLDVQVGKKDELFTLDSGLTVLDALSELEEKAFALFENTMLKIQISSGGMVTFKTATHIATELAKGVVQPIMAQIDPMHVGEVARALKIGREYGKRLGNYSMNLQDDSLKRLVEKYPSHGFVIDRNEAGELFFHVRDASPEEKSLIALRPLTGVVRVPHEDDDEAVLSFLSEPRKEVADAPSNTQNSGDGSTSNETGSTPIEAILGDKESAGIEQEPGIAGKPNGGAGAA